MKVTLKESTEVVYQQMTHQIKVDIDGVEYLIRNSEDDNGTELYVYSETLGSNWINPYTLEDSELKDTIIKLGDNAYDSFLFSDSNEGKEIDLEDLE